MLEANTGIRTCSDRSSGDWPTGGVVVHSLIEGDLLVLPRWRSCCHWLTIGLIGLAHWLLTVGAPPLLTTAGTAAAAGWSAISEDPVGGRLHAVATVG